MLLSAGGSPGLAAAASPTSHLVRLQVLRNGSYELGAELEEHDEGALAKDVRPGPLRIAGLQQNDTIISLDGINLRGKTTHKDYKRKKCVSCEEH